MNKLLIMPIMVMVILTVVSFVSGGNLTGDGFSVDVNGSFNNTTSTYEGTGGGLFNFNLFSGDGLLITLIALSAAGIIAGIGLFGSGLSDTSQQILLKSVGFLGLWGALSIFAKGLIIDDTGIFGILIYFGLTIMFGIGFLIDVTGSGAN